MNTSLFLILPALFALVLAGPHKHILSPSGRKIPLNLIRKHLPDHPHHLLRHALFEHSFKRGTVRSSRHHLHIEALAPTVKPIRERAGFSYSLNGRPHPIHKEYTIVRQGPKHHFTLIQHNGNMIIAAAWAQGINLRPLHPNLYPDILINTHRPGQIRSSRADMLKDFKVVKANNDKAESHYLDDSLNVTARQATTCTTSDPDRFYEIAAAYDKSFCATYDNVAAVATAVIQGMVIAANVPYTSATCLSLALIRVDAFCADSPTDPYAAPAALAACAAGDINCRPSAILSNFQTVYQTQFTGNRDIALLVSGYEDGTGVSGFASLPGSCSTTNGYAWVESTNPFVLAHELGHTLSADHVPNGIMKATISSGDTTFSAASVATITNYVLTNAGASCITTAAPACDSTCPTGTGCRDGFCVRSPATAPATGVLCTPLNNFFFCVAPVPNFNAQEAVSCAAGFTHVQRTPNPADPTILCCTAPTNTDSVDLIAAENTQETTLQGLGLRNIVATGQTTFVGTIIAASVTTCSTTPSPSPTPTPSVSPSVTVSPSPGIMIGPGTLTPTPTPSVTPSQGTPVSLTPSPSPSPQPSLITLPGPGMSPPPSVFVLPGPSIFILPGPSDSGSRTPQPSLFILPPATSVSASPTPSLKIFILPAPVMVA